VPTYVVQPQVGAVGGLHTHTPVDWGGNEKNPPDLTYPLSWPQNAFEMDPADGEGMRPGQPGSPVAGPS
jgi:hypothetical protein